MDFKHFFDSNGREEITITLQPEDIEYMVEENSSAYSDYELNSGEEIGIEVVSSARNVPVSLHCENPDGEVFDDALDALMVMCMAFRDLERKIKDNDAHPDDWTMEGKRLVEQVRRDHDVAKAENSFTYYDRIRRGKPVERK